MFCETAQERLWQWWCKTLTTSREIPLLWLILKDNLSAVLIPQLNQCNTSPIILLPLLSLQYEIVWTALTSKIALTTMRMWILKAIQLHSLPSITVGSPLLSKETATILLRMGAATLILVILLSLSDLNEISNLSLFFSQHCKLGVLGFWG